MFYLFSTFFVYLCTCCFCLANFPAPQPHPQPSAEGAGIREEGEAKIEDGGSAFVAASYDAEYMQAVEQVRRECAVATLSLF